MANVIESAYPYFPLGFPVSRKSSDQLGLLNLLASGDSHSHRRELYAIRVLAERMNDIQPGSPVSGGQLIALSLIIEILRYFMDRYCFEEFPGSLHEGLEWIGSSHGPEIAEKPVPVFVDLFPPWQIETQQTTREQFLTGKTIHGASNRLLVVREMVLLSLTLENQAAKPFQILFDDSDLKAQAPYEDLIEALELYFDSLPDSSELGMPLFEALRAPSRANPKSLQGQLDFILEKWAGILPEVLRTRLVISRDLLREETKPRGFGGGPAPVLTFGQKVQADGDYFPEFERFTPDRDWMSNVVLMAKSVYVWLDQISKTYGEPVMRLDQIPDRELDRLAAWGFTGLWLIGVWERPSASQRIKQMRGNPEAAASAYSLYDYVIANDLGGEQAYQNLKERAWRRGIRLASDMVPNHMGLDSRWVMEHPHWFVQLDYPPFPSYTFTGPDLSRDWRISLRIEDGYWDHRDASVVFQRVDNWTGDVRYIYHGNDGTHMPWNDTAQLNYLLPEVREAVIQTILHVARKFPIIRFDAAMTLTKRHFQRLWFPPPGHGGDIPSRAEHGISREEFNQRMPEEFWREVVDRIALEAPDTLLLAEAFWLMEGFFVRTLGMHRVYNSAFMNMLKSEENANYRSTVKNVLEFSPEVLRRFVNFMNNPDEKTAVEQFGKGDKYFGVCLLMVTMPGLPMFGHGQIEGFAEKYGMEYRRAYWDETVDMDLVRRHEAAIFPLMRKRYLFSGVDNFAFYDFCTPEGHVNEDVFAYSNRSGQERAVILYNNRLSTTTGWIRVSTQVNEGRQDETRLVTRTLGDALGLTQSSQIYYLFKDYKDGLEYVRSGQQIHEEGLFVQLHGYQYHAFLDFREIRDLDGTWAIFAESLSGKGVPDIETAYKEHQLADLLEPFRSTLQEAQAIYNSLEPAERDVPEERNRGLKAALLSLQEAMVGRELPSFEVEEVLEGICEDALSLQTFMNSLEKGSFPDGKPFLEVIAPSLDENRLHRLPCLLVAWSVLRHLESCFVQDKEEETFLDWVEKWMLDVTAARTVSGPFPDLPHLPENSQMLKTLLSHPDAIYSGIPSGAHDYFEKLFSEEAPAACLQIHEFGGVKWLNRECLESLMVHLLSAGYITLTTKGKPASPPTDILHSGCQAVADIVITAEEAGYAVSQILWLLK